MLDVEKLIKLLNLACSADAHEAHTAMRFAGKLLEKNSLTWAEVIAVPSSTARNKLDEWEDQWRARHKPNFYADPNPKPDDDIIRDHYSRPEHPNQSFRPMPELDMFEYLLTQATVPYKTESFVRSLERFYQTNGYLSDKQYEKLSATYYRYGGA